MKTSITTSFVVLLWLVERKVRLWIRNDKILFDIDKQLKKKSNGLCFARLHYLKMTDCAPRLNTQE